jgi:predicted Fe-S protein YdhL (DUF1289 family)
MSGEIWSRAEIESPCKRICVMDDGPGGSGLCLGCFRTRPEIATWSRLTPEARRAVMAELPAREAEAGKRGRRGGRSARRGG